jgi:hypothetical protein
MKSTLGSTVEAARRAALEVLLHNARGPIQGLPRTAGWGYPEPYTRDLMVAALGILVSGNEDLIASLRRVLLILARHQTRRGHIPGLVHDPSDLGASDTTPLFLIGLVLFRQVTGEADFLAEAAQKALTWMEYQSPDDLTFVAQQPTSDWRDEQWVLGYGLYVNTLVYTALRLHRRYEEAQALRRLINQKTLRARRRRPGRHEGLSLREGPYYALWAYKVYQSERFDLLGNCLAILSGIASPSRAKRIVAWVESQCQDLRARGELIFELPPCLFPYIRPGDSDWHPRYAAYNLPGHYHNGGIWPFVCAFYIAALVAARQFSLAERKLHALTELVRPARNHTVTYGFNEWFRAQDGSPQGQDWQSWSAAMYLYAASAVERQGTPFFDEVRRGFSRS